LKRETPVDLLDEIKKVPLGKILELKNAIGRLEE